MRRLPLRSFRRLLSAAAVIWLSQGVAIAASIVLLPLQDQTGDQEGVEAVQRELATQLLNLGSIIESGEVRQTLRRLRVRQAEKASPETLTQVGTDLGADWLISVTIHEASRDQIPRLTLSARAYHRETGEMFWAGFHSGSGLTPRTVLGLKQIRTLSRLAQWVVKHLVEDLSANAVAGDTPSGHTDSRVANLGRVAIVPFGGLTLRRATAHSETVTEAVRAVAFRKSLDLLSPNLVNSALQQQSELRWGAITIPLRESLNQRHGADTILTGSVEAFEIDASPDGPRPRIAISLRLIDARTGQVLWTDGEEKDIARRPGHFGIRRVYTLGDLTEKVVGTLTRRLLKEYTNISANGS